MWFYYNLLCMENMGLLTVCLNDENIIKGVVMIYFAVCPMKSNINWIRIHTPIYIFAVSGQTERFIKVIEPVLWGWEWRNGPLVS